MPKKITSVAFWPDTHDPWHDVQAVKVAEDIVECLKPDVLCFTGDYHDCHSASKYPKNVDKMVALLEDEVGPGIERRNRIASNAKRVVFLEGNHCRRIKTYMDSQAPLLSNRITTKTELKIPKKWTYIPYGKTGFWRVGPLTVCHGFFCTKHAAQKHLDEFKVPILFGHTHRVQVSTARRLHEGTISAYNIGWLGDPVKAADYCDVPPDWMQAITWGYFTDNSYSIQIIPIKNGKAIFNGKMYSAKN